MKSSSSFGFLVLGLEGCELEDPAPSGGLGRSAANSQQLLFICSDRIQAQHCHTVYTILLACAMFEQSKTPLYHPSLERETISYLVNLTLARPESFSWQSAV